MMILSYILFAIFAIVVMGFFLYLGIEAYQETKELRKGGSKTG